MYPHIPFFETIIPSCWFRASWVRLLFLLWQLGPQNLETYHAILSWAEWEEAHRWKRHRGKSCAPMRHGSLSQPSVTRAVQIVESSGRTETNEGPRVHEGETYHPKKYICISIEFDQIGPKNISTTWWKVGLLSLLDYYKFSHKCAAEVYWCCHEMDIVCKCGSCVMVSFLRYYLALAAIFTFRAVGRCWIYSQCNHTLANWRWRWSFIHGTICQMADSIQSFLVMLTILDTQPAPQPHWPCDNCISLLTLSTNNLLFASRCPPPPTPSEPDTPTTGG